MPLKGALVGWQGSSSGGGKGTGADRISLTKYPENWMEAIYWGIQDYARIRAGVGFPRIPVGAAIDRRDIPVSTSNRVPPVVIPSGTASKVLGSIIAREPVFNKGRLPVVRTPVPLPPVRTSPSVTTGGLAKGGQKLGLDLGAISKVLGTVGDFIPGPDFFDLGSSVLNWSGAGPANVPGGTGGPVITQPGTGVAGTSMGTLPNLPTAAGSCEPDDPMKGYIMKKVCGQWRWIKPKRRRRKPLLTEADYNALLRIESLKVNKNMTVAIAKTLSR